MENELLLTLVICSLIILIPGLPVDPMELLGIDGKLSVDQNNVEPASLDFSLLTRSQPLAVLHPDSAKDVAQVVKAAYRTNRGLPISARGHGHSINAQAQTKNGVVIQMSRSKEGSELDSGRKYPPQPRFWARESNVHELDVVTGKGELSTCSEDQNPELFHAVLGGLGPFGIITRARNSLEPAPERPGCQKFDYVEGFVIVDEGLINNRRSSFFSPRNTVKISSLVAAGGVLYCLEIAKNYHETTAETIDQSELKLRSKGLWEFPHPWLNLFIPKSKIAEFDKGVFRGILGNRTSGPILIYRMNKDKWDQWSSMVTPDEGVFYVVALLTSASDNGEVTQSSEYLTDQNRQILRYRGEAGINVKQYLPHYSPQQEWMDHFGSKGDWFCEMKMEFDPRHILATGQQIFTPTFSSSSNMAS
ncbi:Cytokinin dehydrogenase 5 [Hibiscus syriacus]|uniref:cytokinin dehydrogenase n=1 Tax=Hibiscus syriacus TaxID=106335 RepID=A0A6A2W8S8_HIBSY|nr:Cytokinin dehydrogenase 5 [Hibiscus syriacus]